MDEKSVERLLKNRVEEMIPGAKCLKFVSPGYSGVPDWIILLPGGTVIFVELKSPGEQPRQRQIFVQSQLRKLGFMVAGCVDSPEAVNKVVQICVMVSGQAKQKNQARMLKSGTGAKATQEAGEFADTPVLGSAT